MWRVIKSILYSAPTTTTTTTTTVNTTMRINTTQSTASNSTRYQNKPTTTTNIFVTSKKGNCYLYYSIYIDGNAPSRHLLVQS